MQLFNFSAAYTGANSNQAEQKKACKIEKRMKATNFQEYLLQIKQESSKQCTATMLVTKEARIPDTKSRESKQGGKKANKPIARM